MARLKPVSEQFRIARRGTAVEVQRFIVATAKREHAKIMTTDPRPASFTRFVDGKAGAPEEDVGPTGTILYEYPRIDAVAEFALETLRKLSPVGSVGDKHPGLYRDSHMLFLNATPVDLAGLAAWKPGDEVSIANPLPYARKIEIGKMKMRVPGTDHVYQQAVQVVNGRFGNVAKARFTYRALAIGSMPATAVMTGGQFDIPRVGPLQVKRGRGGRFAPGNMARAGNQAERDARRPAMILLAR